MINKLNTANRMSDMQTNIYFYIDSSSPAHLKLFSAIDEKQKLLLCEKIKPSNWWPSNDDFPNLSEFIAFLINSKVSYDNLTSFLLTHIFKLPS